MASSLEYGDTDATGARIGGLPTKYTTASVDGVAVSTSDRAIDLTDLTSTGIETIELVHTLTASMDAGAAAGRLNFSTRDPFSRRRNQFRYQVGLNGHSTALNWGGAYMPDDRRHRVIFPSWQFGYGGIFFNRRLAIDINISSNGTYNMFQQQHTRYSYRNPDTNYNPDFPYAPNEPVITNLSWRLMPQFLNRFGGNLKRAHGGL